MQLLAILLSMVVPQAPGPASAYAVAYVDVRPEAVSQAITAFKQYRDSSRREEGFVRFEVFEQSARPGHLAIVETWAAPAALDAHAAAASMKQWRTKIDSIRISDYDQRPYKTVTLGSTPGSAGERAIYVITHVDIGGRGADPSELLHRQADASRRDGGNLRFDVLQHAMRANHFTVIEAWSDQRALDAHAANPHTREYRDALSPISGSPLDERIYKVAP